MHLNQGTAHRDLQRDHFNNKWAELTASLASKSKDLKEFWQHVRTLMGNDTIMSPYLYDHQGNKLYTEAEKEAVHRIYWRNVYQISNTENLLFDQETEEQVIEDLALQADQINPDHYINLSNLSAENPLISPITLEEIIEVTKQKIKHLGSVRSRNRKLLTPHL